MAGASAVPLALVAYLDRIAKKTRSSAVSGDSIHYRTDIGASVAVLAGAAISYYTGISRIDGALSILVALYVFNSALHLLKVGVRALFHVGAPEERVAPLRSALDAMLASR